MAARERAVATAVLVVLGFVAAAVAVFYAVTRNRLLSHALGYHRDRAIIFGAVAIVLWVAAAIVARLRTRPA
jgi:type VI protein secretion system component VasK